MSQFPLCLVCCVWLFCAGDMGRRRGTQLKVRFTRHNTRRSSSQDVDNCKLYNSFIGALRGVLHLCQLNVSSRRDATAKSSTAVEEMQNRAVIKVWLWGIYGGVNKTETTADLTFAIHIIVHTDDRLFPLAWMASQREEETVVLIADDWNVDPSRLYL